ncbi:hypothetical protein CRYUN_Cryun21dG0013300 [Craigia yunnanensis]
MGEELNEENECRDRDDMDVNEKSNTKLAKVHNLAGDDNRSSVLDSIKGWIQVVFGVCESFTFSFSLKATVRIMDDLFLLAIPMQFLNALLSYHGDSISFDQQSSGLKSPLASQPSSFYSGTNTPSEGLVRWKLWLEYFAYETLQHLRIAKLFEIIVDYPERYRLLTAGASTNDILHQYVSTIKELRTIDPAGVFLEAVGEPIRDYLKERKDTIKCIVTMLTDGTSVIYIYISYAVIIAILLTCVSVSSIFFSWEPDPVEVDPSKGSRNRRKVDILGMIVGIIGSKDQLVNEYRVMLAEKLLNKSDYDIDSEIRTLELLKDEALIIPDPVDQLLSDYARRFQEIRLLESYCGRKILEQSRFGPLNLNLCMPLNALFLVSIILELQFEDKAMQFTVALVHAAITMQFQDQTSWTSKNLAATTGIPVDVLNRRISFWIRREFSMNH